MHNRTLIQTKRFDSDEANFGPLIEMNSAAAGLHSCMASGPGPKQKQKPDYCAGHPD